MMMLIYLVLRVELDQLRKRGKLLSPVQVVEVPRVLDLDVRHLTMNDDQCNINYLHADV